MSTWSAAAALVEEGFRVASQPSFNSSRDAQSGRKVVKESKAGSSGQGKER